MHHPRRALMPDIRFHDNLLDPTRADVESPDELLRELERHERVAPPGEHQDLLAQEGIRGVGRGVWCTGGVVLLDVRAEAVGEVRWGEGDA